MLTARFQAKRGGKLAAIAKAPQVDQMDPVEMWEAGYRDAVARVSKPSTTTRALVMGDNWNCGTKASII